MPSTIRKPLGFTLIEVLIAITISTALIGVGVAGYRDFAARQAVDAGVRVLYSGLRLTQTQATSGAKPAGCVGSFDGYRFRFLTTGTVIDRFEARPVCGGVESPGPVTNFPSNVTVTLSPTTPGAFLFKPLGLGTDLSPASPATITISRTVAGATRSFQVVVSSSGEIR